MRQAGRSLPEYRALRVGSSMLDACLSPDLVVEITLQPVRRHGVDAAIFFSDIVVPLKLAGVEVEIQPGVGPVIENPVRDRIAFGSLSRIDPQALAPIVESVERLIGELESVPLIGFGGAPFTVASYLIEGGPSKDLPHTRALMTDDPDLFRDILDWCADVTVQFVRAQVESGASALQIFDSWAGKLSPEEYRAHAWPVSKRLLADLATLVDASGLAVPRIHFGIVAEELLCDLRDAGATAVGVGAEVELSRATQLLGDVPLQGNLSTDILTAPWPEIERAVKAVIDSGKSAPGHVFNLGHGVPKDTDPEVLTKIVALVHEVS